MFANSNESIWMAAGILFPLAVVWGGEATESLDDLRQRIFGNTKAPTK